MTDNDWPVALRRITDDDEKKFPKHDAPEPPSESQKEEHRNQVEKERHAGHPADKRRDPDLEPVDDSLDED